MFSFVLLAMYLICIDGTTDDFSPLQDQPGCSGSGVLREIQCCVCSQLHQMFIAVPDIAKLVHFQVCKLKLKHKKKIKAQES